MFAIAFSTFLMSHQMPIFVGLLNRTQSQIKDIADANVWIMDPKTEYLDEVRSLANQDLYRVRGVADVLWGVPLFKGNARVKASDGQFRNAILWGLDDATLVGLPRKFLAGNWRALQYVDSFAIDEVGFRRFFPGQAYSTGHRLDIGDKTVTIGAVVEVSPPFVNLPAVYARYSEAIRMWKAVLP